MKLDRLTQKQKIRLLFRNNQPLWDGQPVSTPTLITPHSMTELCDKNIPRKEHIEWALKRNPETNIVLIGCHYKRDWGMIEFCNQQNVGCEWLSIAHTCELYQFILHDQRPFVALIYPSRL